MNIEINHVYRAKKPRRIGLYYNDRMVLWVSDCCVQYDSSSLDGGYRYPLIDRAKFEAWAGSDVTEGYPKGDWALYPR